MMWRVPPAGVDRPGRHGPAGQLQRAGHLPCLHAGRPLCLAAQGAVFQRLQLRLQLLRQPPLQPAPARHPLPPRELAELTIGFYRPQLYRGSFPVQRSARQPGCHHGAHDRSFAHPAAGIPLQRLHPRQGHPRGRPAAHRAPGPAGRPPFGQHRTAKRNEPQPPRAGQGQGGDPAPDAPDRPAERGQPPGTGRLPACPRLCPGRAEHTR